MAMEELTTPLLTASAQQAQIVKADIQSHNDKIGDLFTNADYDRSVLQYTEDCKVLIPKQGLIQGRPGMWMSMAVSC